MLKNESNSCSIFRYIEKVDTPRTVFSISSVYKTSFVHVFLENEKWISSYWVLATFSNCPSYKVKETLVFFSSLLIQIIFLPLLFTRANIWYESILVHWTFYPMKGAKEKKRQSVYLWIEPLKMKIVVSWKSIRENILSF